MDRPQISIITILKRKQAHWIIGLGLLFTLVFSVIFVIEWREAGMLARHGVETEATVERTFTTRERTGSEGRRQTVHNVAYRFELPDGEARTDRLRVSQDYYRAVSQGDRVDLRYLPDDPTTAELEFGRTRRQSVMWGLVALGIAGATGGYGWWLWQRMGAMIRAVRKGEKRSARVLGMVRSNAQKDDEPLMHLHWIDSAGQEGHSLKYPAETLYPWPRDSEITVYADPRTGQTFWEEDLKA